MKVLFSICIKTKDGSVWMEMEGELPFPPSPGDVIRFCGNDCCDGLPVGDTRGCCVFSYPDQRFELSFFDSPFRQTLDKRVEHYKRLGFVESPETREMYKSAKVV